MRGATSTKPSLSLRRLARSRLLRLVFRSCRVCSPGNVVSTPWRWKGPRGGCAWLESCATRRSTSSSSTSRPWFSATLERSVPHGAPCARYVGARAGTDS
jgi:hypothetical protein